MNEQIKELALQAGMKTTSLHYGRKDPYVLWEDDIETFAELIVRECVGLIVKENDGEEYGTGSDWGDGYTAGLNTAKLAIEEHFEIK